MSHDVIARAPTRIDFGGGWTDVPPFCDREGGFVCNAAIDRYVSVQLSSQPQRALETDDAPLVRAALARRGAHDLRVEIRSDVPVGAGLGGSSAASAALLSALDAWRGVPPADRVAIAELGRRIEVEDLGIAGGRQDHYAATHGGMLGLTFDHTVHVSRLAVSEATRRTLIERAVLIYTGQSRISGDTITAVLGAYEQRVPRVVEALRRIRALAREMASALERGDLDALGELVGEHWTYQRALHPSIPTPRIDEIVARSRDAGALGAKAMGASGGGCVLVITRAEARDGVQRAIASLGELLTFGLDDAGVSVLAAAS